MGLAIHNIECYSSLVLNIFQGGGHPPVLLCYTDYLMLWRVSLIPCNLYLKRISRSDTYRCATCQMLDDLPHYLHTCNCEETTRFWSGIANWWNNKPNEQVTLNEKAVMIE